MVAHLFVLIFFLSPLMKNISLLLLALGTLFLTACSSSGSANNGSMNGMQHNTNGMQHNMNNM